MKKLILLFTLYSFSSVSWAECVEGDCVNGKGIVTHRVTGPDGRVHKVEGPRNASPEDVVSFVRRKNAEEKRLLDAKKSSAIVGSPATSYRGNKQRYPIEVAHNDELFIINGEKYEAKTYCFNMEEGDSVIFLEGSALGVCLSAELLNLRSGTECRVWCE